MRAADLLVAVLGADRQRTVVAERRRDVEQGGRGQSSVSIFSDSGVLTPSAIALI